MTYQELEEKLRTLLTGEFSSLYITLNDENGPNYQTVERCLENGGFDHADWVSEDSKRRAVATNRAWVIQWYPRTPMAFEAVAGATLGEVLERALREGERK